MIEYAAEAEESDLVPVAKWWFMFLIGLLFPVYSSRAGLVKGLKKAIEYITRGRSMRKNPLPALFLCLTSILLPPSLSAQSASPDNPADCIGVKGDFLVFSLKDPREKVIEKIGCLKKLNIKAHRPNIERKLISLALTMDDEIVECYFDFCSGKVHTIRVRYQTFFPEEKFGEDFYRDLLKKKSLLTSQFGEPSRTVPFPKLEEIKNGKTGAFFPVNLWEREGRKIALGIYPWGSKEYRTAVDFIDEKLSEEEKQNILDAKNVPYYYIFLGEDDTHTALLWIDEGSIKLVENAELKNEVIDFWLRIEYTQEGRRNFVQYLTEKGFAPEVYKNYKYSLYHYQCYKTKYLVLRYGFYSYEKTLLIADPAPQWIDPAPGTLGEKLLQEINKYAEKKLKK